MAQKQVKTQPKKQNRAQNEIRIDEIDYKNIKVLQRFVGKRNQIIPRKYTKVSAKVQRKIASEVKKARIVGLLKYTERH